MHIMPPARPKYSNEEVAAHLRKVVQEIRQGKDDPAYLPMPKELDRKLREYLKRPSYATIINRLGSGELRIAYVRAGIDGRVSAREIDNFSEEMVKEKIRGLIRKLGHRITEVDLDNAAKVDETFPCSRIVLWYFDSVDTFNLEAGMLKIETRDTTRRAPIVRASLR